MSGLSGPGLCPDPHPALLCSQKQTLKMINDGRNWTGAEYSQHAEPSVYDGCFLPLSLMQHLHARPEHVLVAGQDGWRLWGPQPTSIARVGSGASWMAGFAPVQTELLRACSDSVV